MNLKDQDFIKQASLSDVMNCYTNTSYHLENLEKEYEQIKDSDDHMHLLFLRIVINTHRGMLKELGEVIIDKEPNFPPAVLDAVARKVNQNRDKAEAISIIHVQGDPSNN